MKKLLSIRNILSLLPFLVAIVSPNVVFAAPTDTNVNIVGPLGLIGPSQVIQFIIFAAFALAIILAVVYLIWGGINWILSGGEKEKVDAARKRIIAAIVGLILVALAVVILNFVLTLLGFCGLFNFHIPTITHPTFETQQC